MISYAMLFQTDRRLSESSSGEEDFGFDDPWVVVAFILLAFLFAMVIFRLWTKYCCEVKLNPQALKQKVGISKV